MNRKTVTRRERYAFGRKVSALAVLCFMKANRQQSFHSLKPKQIEIMMKELPNEKSAEMAFSRLQRESK